MLQENEIRRLSEVSLWRSVLKLSVYVCAVGTSVYLVLSSKSLIAELVWMALLGATYAHGIELQHECLHLNLIRNKRLSRVLGVMLGAPMLVSYTHYRLQHFHHHRYVGTFEDAEIFDYSARQIGSPLGVVARLWNLARIPAFLLTAIGLLQNEYPAVVVRNAAARRHLRQEYGLLFTLISLSCVGVFALDQLWIVEVWWVPWLLVAEPLHSIVEMPEHIGCIQESTDPLKNSRSYRTNPVWRYIINGNNCHVAHHLWPSVAVHNLPYVDAAVTAHAQFTESSFWSALKAVRRAVSREPAMPDSESEPLLPEGYTPSEENNAA